MVLGEHSNAKKLKLLTSRAMINGAHLWAQLGHAGALSHLPISKPKVPSALKINGLRCAGMIMHDIKGLIPMYAKAALKAKNVGFSGILIHGGHGFLLSQFLSALFNHRTYDHGGSIKDRCRIVLEIIKEVRNAIGSSFPVGIRINSLNQLIE